MALQLLQYGLVSVSTHWFQQDQSWETLCSENKNTYFSIYPSTVGSENWTRPLVFSFSPSCFPPCQAEQTEQTLAPTVPLPKVCKRRIWWMSWISWPRHQTATRGPQQMRSAHETKIQPCADLAQQSYSWLNERNAKNHCLMPAPLQASSSCLLWAVEHSSSYASALAIKTLCTLPVMLSLPVAWSIL